MHHEGLVVVVDLEEQSLPLGRERSEIVLLVRIILMAEVVKHSDRLDDPLDRVWPKCCDARRDHGQASDQVLSEFVVKRSDTGYLIGHHVLHRRAQTTRSDALWP